MKLACVKPRLSILLRLLLVFMLASGSCLAVNRVDSPTAQASNNATGASLPPPGLSNEAWQKVLKQINASDATVEPKKIYPTDGLNYGDFGVSVALADDLLAVGADWTDIGATAEAGAVYLFARNAGGADNWGQVKKLTASDGAAGDYFGYDVALSGDVLVVSAVKDDVGGNVDQGSAYIFMRNAGGADNWAQVKKLLADDGAANDWFGNAVDVDGDIVVVGVRLDQVGGENAQGSAFIYQRNRGGVDQWGMLKHLVASDGVRINLFGVSVAVSGDTIAIGADYRKVYSVQEHGAVYLFMRNQGGADNWGQFKTIWPGEAYIKDHFGGSLDLSGDTLVAGAREHDTWGNEDQGAAYVFSRHTGGMNNWGEVKELISSDGKAHDRFGVSVAISGDTIVVGADHAGAYTQGEAYTYLRNAGGADQWGEVKIMAGAWGDLLGLTVAVNGELIAAGAPSGGHIPLEFDGAVYLYGRYPQPRSNWQQKSPMLANNGEARDWFGAAVALSSDTLAVGAQGDDVDGKSNQGSLYLFGRNEIARNAGGTDNWILLKQVMASDGATDDNFASALAIAGDLLVVGAETDDVGAGIDQGSAYLFARNAGGVDNWGLLKQLIASDGTSSDNFGSAVAIDDEFVAIGAPSKAVGGAFSQGVVYLFQRNAGGADNWGEVKKLTASDGAASDQFGISLALNQATLAVGAYGADLNGNDAQGAAYLFARHHGRPDTWGEVRKVVAGDGAASDWFGWSVALAGDQLVVGAPFADVSSNFGQGAAYLFQRNLGGADQWAQVTKLLANDGQPDDQFGFAVATWGDWVAAGAHDADVGGNFDQGAVYIFSRNFNSGDSWSQSKKLLASDGAANDQLGAALAASEEGLVVGSHFKDVAANLDQGAVYLYLATANSVPTVQEDVYTVVENGVLTVSAPGILANDSDANSDPITATLLSPPSNGELNLSLDGGFVYTPTLNFSGLDSFSYQASDGISASLTATVTITVTALEYQPIYLPLVTNRSVGQ
ncbi:MAG: Ig-like domain-containing protein [Caldilineaceae bacterium]